MEAEQQLLWLVSSFWCATLLQRAQWCRHSEVGALAIEDRSEPERFHAIR